MDDAGDPLSMLLTEAVERLIDGGVGGEIDRDQRAVALAGPVHPDHAVAVRQRA